MGKGLRKLELSLRLLRNIIFNPQSKGESFTLSPFFFKIDILFDYENRIYGNAAGGGSEFTKNSCGRSRSRRRLHAARPTGRARQSSDLAAGQGFCRRKWSSNFSADEDKNARSARSF